MLAGTFRFALSCLLAIVLAACSQEARPGPPWTPDDFARAWLDAFGSHDIDRLLTYYTDDALLEDVTIVESRGIAPARGHRMIREFLVPMFEEMPDLAFEFVSASSAGDRMVVEWVMTGTRYRHFSGSFSIRGVSVIELAEGKIASERDYYDAYLLLSQLDAIPTRGTEQSDTSGQSVPRCNSS